METQSMHVLHEHPFLGNEQSTLYS